MLYENSITDQKDEIDLFDIEMNHIDEVTLIQNIDYIELNKTLFTTITEDIQINFMLEINEIFLSETTWVVPLSSSDFVFKWNIEESEVVEEVPISITMNVSVSDEATRIIGDDKYEFLLTKENLFTKPINDTNIYKILGFTFIILIVLAFIVIGVSALVGGKK